jgi:metal-responsive CopG/Arc/MetJ family transcriptional regulator
MGDIKTTITIDEELWKRFSILVIQEKGNRKKNEVIGQLIMEYIKKKERQ